LITVAAVWTGLMLPIYRDLPPTVASHFDARGNPNGWMSKEMFVIVEAAILIFVVGQFLLVPFLVRRLPNSLINLPNREYWLSDEHREETLSIVGSYFEIFGAAILVFFIVVNQFVYQANVSKTNLSSSMWFIVVGFLVFTLVWLIKLIREFKVN